MAEITHRCSQSPDCGPGECSYEGSEAQERDQRRLERLEREMLEDDD